MARRQRQVIKKGKWYSPNIYWILETVIVFAILFIIFMVSPEDYFTIVVFLVLVLLAVALPAYLVSRNPRRSMFAGLLVSGILGLRALAAGNIFNVLLLLAATTVFEFYFTKSVDS